MAHVPTLLIAVLQNATCCHCVCGALWWDLRSQRYNDRRPPWRNIQVDQNKKKNNIRRQMEKIMKNEIHTHPDILEQCWQMAAAAQLCRFHQITSSISQQHLSQLPHQISAGHCPWGEEAAAKLFPDWLLQGETATEVSIISPWHIQDSSRRNGNGTALQSRTAPYPLAYLTWQ